MDKKECININAVKVFYKATYHTFFMTEWQQSCIISLTAGLVESQAFAFLVIVIVQHL